MAQNGNLLLDIERAVFEKTREYEDPNNIEELRTYHVFKHGPQVAQEAKASDEVVCIRPATERHAMIAIALAHDIIPPSFAIDIDTNRPWPFTYKRIQIFDGLSELASFDWFKNLFGDRFDEDTFNFIHDGFVATTTSISKSGEIQQSKIMTAKNPKAAFIIAKADILGHQFTALPREQIDCNLRFWLEQYPDFVAKLYDPNFVLNSEVYQFVREQISKIPENAIKFYKQQLDLFIKDGKEVFCLADLKALEARLFLANTTPFKTFDHPDWPWVKDKDSLIRRLRSAIGIKLN
ncbi:MAG: hypothetical protein AAB459_01180 [Patescibacteria group bacterium]